MFSFARQEVRHVQRSMFLSAQALLLSFCFSTRVPENKPFQSAGTKAMGKRLEKVAREIQPQNSAFFSAQRVEQPCEDSRSERAVGFGHLQNEIFKDVGRVAFYQIVEDKPEMTRLALKTFQFKSPAEGVHAQQPGD